MHQFTGKVIFILVVVSFFLGLLVVTFKPNYTIQNNIRSNRSYYPSVKVGAPEADSKNQKEEDAGAQGY